MGTKSVSKALIDHLKELSSENLLNKSRLVEEKDKVPIHGSIGALTSFLVDKKIIDEKKYLEYFSGKSGIEIVNLEELKVDPAIHKIIKVSTCRRYDVMPLAVDELTLTCAAFFVGNLEAEDDLRRASGRAIIWKLAARSQILDKINDFYVTANEASLENLISEIGSEPITESVEEEASKIDEAYVLDNPQVPPLVRLIHTLLLDAITRGASDVHIEPTEDDIVVRMRYDGTLKEIASFKTNIGGGIVSRIKVMAALDISEKRRPQDGKARVRRDRKSEVVDLRVSTIPTMFGEKIVIRVLDGNNLNMTMEQIGHTGQVTRDFSLLLKRPHGVIIVTGPTGSGKSTTLYVALKSLANEETNITTIEDPIEYHLEYLNQIGINPKKGLTFASALRSILRQDPDVIMIGEIRDAETAKLAMEAAQTGHLVLTTLHTNDASSAITRLLDLGVPGYAIQSSLIGVLAQRLMKKLCPECKEEEILDDEDKQILTTCKGLTLEKTHHSVGCAVCRKSGYKGRTAIGELLVMDDDIRRIIAKNGTDLEIRQAAIASGMVPLETNGYMHVISGATSLREAFKVAGPCNMLEAPQLMKKYAGANSSASAPENNAVKPVKIEEAEARNDRVIKDMTETAGEKSASSTEENTSPYIKSEPCRDDQRQFADKAWLTNYIKSKVAKPLELEQSSYRHKILVVDDDRFLRETIAKSFSADYRVRTAQNGAEALKLITVEAPDAVILDIMMPEMSGFEVLQVVRLNEQLENVRVIMLTSETSRTDQLLGMHLGADDYITKPFDMDILKARVRTVLKRR